MGAIEELDKKKRLSEAEHLSVELGLGQTNEKRLSEGNILGVALSLLNETKLPRVEMGQGLNDVEKIVNKARIRSVEQGLTVMKRRIKTRNSSVELGMSTGDEKIHSVALL